MPIFDSFAKLGRAAMGRAERGLYGGKEKMFGNNVSHSRRRTGRTWEPNVQRKKFYSELLDQTFIFRTTTSVLRTMDKRGGFDNYLLQAKPKELINEEARKIRKLLRDELKKE